MDKIVLKIDLPDNLLADATINQKDIPCVSMIGEGFSIEFQAPLQSCKGEVQNWELKEISLRFPASAGGDYVFNSFSLLSIMPYGENLYEITDLKMFNEHIGWRKVIENSQYATETLEDLYDDEELE